ncbi:menaquinone biosynthesis protein [Paenibacillus alkalitolerans]|uniref:menaquinone biosynthesis protein n=1 Tax=Paenibacillus alkalitolerans TaxID=2799335 RepID=UPI0018F75CCF|nr:menaquinone biosynthesis protein [Paenibacillus alkalitolerans]
MEPRATANAWKPEAARIRLGKIVYTNVWPVFYRFPPETLRGRVRMVTGTPAELNRSLGEGAIDAAAISSFAYAKHADRLLLLPDLSVSSRSAVGSLLLFTKLPLSERLPERIALTNASATTVNLLKILMEKRYRHTPEYADMPPDLHTMMEHCDAAMLIGDDAIRARLSDHPYFVSDLGLLWKEWTGIGMTFAVWAVRDEWAALNPGAVSLLHEALLSSKKEGLRFPADLLDQAVREIGGTETFWRNYFTNLVYDFGEEQEKGLALYFSYAHEMGLLPQVPPLRVWRHHKLIRVNE